MGGVEKCMDLSYLVQNSMLHIQAKEALEAIEATENVVHSRGKLV